MYLSEAELLRVRLHAPDAAGHDVAEFHAEHGAALLDECAVAFRGEALVLEFLLEGLDLHAIHALGAHARVGLDDARELVDGVEALHERRRGLRAVDGDAPAM